MKYYQIPKKNLRGVDVNLEISLKEYGVAWQILPRKNQIRFYVGGAREDHDYIEFFAAEFSLTLDVEKEFSFINAVDVASCCGIAVDEWREQPLEYKLVDLSSYYGIEEIFGEY